MKYGWKDGTVLKSDPQAAGEILEKANSYEEIVVLAKPDDSPIHNDFEWDDKVCGEKYRVQQAMYMVRSLVIVREEPTEPKEIFKVRAFVSTGNRDGKYLPMSVVVKDQDLYQRQLEEAYRELQMFKKKYSHLKELEEILALIDD